MGKKKKKKKEEKSLECKGEKRKGHRANRRACHVRLVLSAAKKGGGGDSDEGKEKEGNNGRSPKGSRSHGEKSDFV